MSKKILSVLLAVVMVLAMGTVAMVSASANIDSLPAVADGCYRYYFFMPDQWVNDYAYTAGIYWWEGTDACASWPGYEATPTGYTTEGGAVYYYDVPTNVTTIIWNNFFDGGNDATADYYKAAVQTVNIGSEYYDVDESVNIPEGTNDFDGMIFMTDVNKIETSPFSGKQTFGGEWAYYYGNGEWGFSAVKGEKEVYNTPAIGWTSDWTVPPDSGVASGDETTPTEPAPTEPVPTETEPAPTETVPAPTETQPAPVKKQVITLGGNIGEATETYAYSDGDTVTYTVKVQAAELFEDIQATVYYDAEVLELVRYEPVVDEPYEICPNLGDPIVNCDLAGQVKFNSIKLRGFDFTTEDVLVTLTFNVIGEGDTAINLDIEEMTIKGDEESYFTGNEQVKTEGITVTATLEGNTVPVEPQPTEPQKPTEPKPTEPKPTEPKPTEPKPTEPKPTEPKPTEPKPTEVAPIETVPTPGTDATSATDTTDAPADVPSTGGNAVYFYVVFAVIALAAAAVVVLRKKANG